MESKLEQAVDLHKQGKLDAAEQIYTQLIESSPPNPTVFHLLGLIYHQRKKHEQAITLIKRAIELDQTQSHFYNNLGSVYFAVERLQQARDCFKKAIEINTQYQDAYFNLGCLLHQQNLLQEATEHYLNALTVNNQNISALNNLADCYTKQDNFELAIETLEKVLIIDPDFIPANYNMANILCKIDQCHQASPYLAKVLKLEPSHSDALLLYCSCIKDQDPAQAEKLLMEVIQKNPLQLDFQIHLANLYFENGNFNHAQQGYETILEHMPDHVYALTLLGRVNLEHRNYEKARTNLRRALQHNQHEPLAWYYLGLVEIQTESYQFAQDCFSEAIINSDKNWEYRVAAEIAKAYCNQFSINWVATLSLEKIVKDRALRHIEPVWSNCLITQPDTFKAIEQKKAKSILKQYPRIPTPHLNPTTTKIGYFSPNFNTHKLNNILAKKLKFHDRSKVEIYAFNTDKPTDTVLASTAKTVDHWIECGHFSNQQIVETIQKFNIDVLIDLGGYHSHSRLPVLAQHPANIQCHLWGVNGGISNLFIDYFFTHESLIPTSDLKYFDDNICYLKNTFIATNFLEKLPEVTKDSFNLPDSFIFCNLDHPCRITPDTVQLWAEILVRCPDSCLWLTGNNQQQIALRNIFEQHEVASTRLLFLPCQDLSKRWPQQFANCWLDTTYSNDIFHQLMNIRAGLPTVTLPGQSMVSKTTASLLNIQKLSRYIAKSRQDYIEKACELYSNRQQYSAFHNDIVASQKKSALFDSKQFIQNLEDTIFQLLARG